jgi:hypothetical protein
LIPNEEFWVDDGGWCSGNSAGIGNHLGRRWRRTIEKAISVLAFDIRKNLSSLGHEVAFGKFNNEIMVHIWD